jgi:hypothetical protein
VLGATAYLWRARYIRRKTAFVTMGVLVIALVFASAWIYTSGTG